MNERTLAENRAEILIVEDSPTQAAAFQHTLERHKFMVSVAKNGIEALAMLRVHKPAMVISDIIMPEMDGYQLCREIKEDDTLKDLPVILLTSLSDPRDVIKGLACGADNFLTKPYNEQYILSRIRYIIANRALQANEQSQLGVEIVLDGDQYFIKSDRLQMLNLLLSSFEAAIQKNGELIEAQKELKAFTEQLEQTVASRTAALRESEARYRLLLESVTDYVYTTLVENGWPTATAHGSGCLAVTGYTAEEYAADPGLWLHMVPEEDRLAVMAQLDSVFAGNTPMPIEHRITHKDGVVRWLRNTPVPHYNQDGILFACDGIVSDITEQKQAEEDLRESELRFRHIFDANSDGLIAVDIASKAFILGNQAIHGMLGYEEEELQKLGVMDIHPPEALPYVLEQFEKQLRGEINLAEDIPVKRKDGSVFYVDINTSHLTLAGKPHILWAFRDVTERKKLEAQLLHAQKMESIGTLAGGVAHDFNNILNVIMGYGEMVMDTLGADSPAQESMKEVLVAADRAAALTKRLLIFSRKEIVEFKPVNINELILFLQKMLVRIIRENIEFHLDLADRPLIVQADTGMIEQVVMNMVTNARDAMLEGGRLSIATDLKEMGDCVAVNGYGKPGGRYALITVSDTGHGMDETTLKRIFEPFFTTKEVGDGTGLGLSISYGIVKQHNGFIKVSSKPGEGTVFKIYLPLNAGVAQDQKLEGAVPVKGGNETVLVAEDDKSLRELNRRVLESFGYHVITAADGEEAISTYMENSEGIDLLMLDMIMPKKNGKEVAEAVRKVSPGIKVLFASGYSMDVISAEELAECSFDFIHKPFQSKKLLLKVREVLDK